MNILTIIKSNIIKYKKILIAVAGLLVCIVLIIHFKQPTDYSDAEMLTVAHHDVVESVTITGRVRTTNRAELAFNRSGRIASLKVQEGSKVKKGAVLASVEMGPLYAQREDALASLAIAQSDNSTTASEQNTLVDSAYRALLTTGLEAYPVNQYSAIAPTVSGTYTGTQEGEYYLDMYNSHAESGYSYKYSGIESGTGTAWTDAPFQLGTHGLYIQFDPDSNYANTEWVVSIPNTRGSQYVTLKSAYDQAKATRDRVLGNQSNQLSIRSEALIKQAQARVASLNAQISEGVITAPFAGTVGGILLEKGENVNAGQTVLTLVGDTQFELTLNVPEIDIAKVSLGDPVVVTLDAYPDETWQGTIQKIAPVETYVDGVPIYETTVSIHNPDDRIRSGMSAQATIETSRMNNVLAIPQYALEQKKKGESTVAVRNADGKVETRIITTGLKGSDGYVEVTSGLSIGDVLVGVVQQ